MPSNSNSKSKSGSKQYFSTIALGIKLSSFVKIPLIHDVPMMDRLTTQELNQLVLEEPASRIKQSTPLGHLLSVIFQSFKVQAPRAEDLRIPLSQIRHSNKQINHQFHQHEPTDFVELWDSKVKSWNWGLPDPLKREHKKSKKVAGLWNALTVALSRHGLKANRANRVWSGAHSTTAIKGEDIPRKPDIVMSDEPNSGWAGIKVVTEVTKSKYRPGKRAAKSLDTKAYIILKHQPWRCFALMLSLCNHYCELCVHVYDHSGSAVSPPFHINCQKDEFLQILSSIVFGNDECIGFDTTMNIRQLKLPVLSHHSRPPRRLRALTRRVITQSTSGTLAKSGDAASGEESGESDEDSTKSGESDEASSRESGYESASSYKPSPPQTSGGDSPSSVFSSLELDEWPDIRTGPPALPSELPPSAISTPLVPFIAQTSVPPNSSPIGKIQVNDNWYDILEVIFSSHGLVGRGTVCYLARKDDQEYIIKDHWVLGNADDEDTLNEVVMLKKMQGVRGVLELVEYSKVKLLTGSDLPVQQEAHARGILHRNCSLNNAIIEDADDDSLGMLIDWEFAVLVTPENNYAIGGTGTVPFMSRQLLQQLKNIIVPSTVKKGASSSSPLAIGSVKQDYSDDLESLFYVFSWVCIGYSGPLGMEHHLNASKAWLPHAWSNRSIAGCFDTKVSFYTTDDGKAAITMQFNDYFKDLILLALEWMDLLRLNFPVQVGSVDGQALHRPIEFDALLKILDKHIAGLKGAPELSPERLLHKRLTDKNVKDVHALGTIIEKMSNQIPVKKRSLNDGWTVKSMKRRKLSNSE
ncbi:hypothetical protein BDR06DRAFT_1014910 [Suillus hirtellus]|nr:hypothetical protein BDR06DRAFT_1014910 [Suillus hirtellus]